MLNRDGLFAAWHRYTPVADGGMRDRYEMNEFGEAVASGCPSGARQLAFTDIYCQLTDQIGHLAAMSVPVVTPSFGIRIPDVVWMSPEKWEGFDRDGPLPFVRDLCVEVLLGNRPCDMDRRVAAYLEGGAKEVVVVRQDGSLEFWGTDGRHPASMLALTLSVEPVYCQDGASASAGDDPACNDSRHRGAETTAAPTVGLDVLAEHP